MTAKNVVTVLALLIAGLAYGYWDYTRKHAPPTRTAAPQSAQPAPSSLPAPPPPPLDTLVTWKGQYDVATQAQARKVLGLANAACALDSLRPYIAAIRMAVETDTDYLWVNREYGWQTVVTVDITIRDDQATWNALGPDPRRVAGHTFHLMAGSGRRPALVADKEWIRDRCEMDVGYAGENGIRDVPELAFLGAAKRKKQRR